jgi:small subunit ribosomal protein S20
MNKKQRNRKIVTQNNRNRLINRRYTSTIKTLSKLFIIKVKLLKSSTLKSEESSGVKLETMKLVKSLYSMIDKATKKGVFHKNRAARKKSKIGLMSKQLQY